MSLLFYCSIALFLLSIYLFQKFESGKITKIIYSLSYFFYILLIGIYIVSFYFTSEGITHAVVYHLNYGITGAGFMEYRKIIFLILILIIISSIIWVLILLKKQKNNSKNLFNLSLIIIIISLFINPTIMDFYSLYAQENKKSIEKFNQYYNEPKIIKNDENKNLIFIYMESLENTYFNDSTTKRLKIIVTKP